ncbi:hypothetical protein BDA96_07G201500 [Sorghum bicolor]|uniref:DC1 domain-containing protein n=1 Tax=Sorghum bicolor TaxID=4558 RepID=A0A921QMD6_SORBI|nr:hypothetical protein BDA96_07G201500 [Sorghum bicolor]
MGAFLSVYGHGHPSHPEHCARFNRVDRNKSPPSPCRMCKLNVETGAAAYRCSDPDGCAVVLHEACYRRPWTLKRHFGHPQHRLTLTMGAGLSCSLCAQPLGTPTVAYSCADSKCAGFSAHPRCCNNLPRSITTPPDLHEHTKLVLRRPSSAPGGKNGGNSSEARPRRTCLKCGKTATTAGRKAAPWSYQCTKCAGVEYCLACVLGNGDDTVRCCCCLPCCDVDPAAVHCVGHLAGALFCGFLSGMGCPGIPAQPYTRDMEPTPKYRT